MVGVTAEAFGDSIDLVSFVFVFLNFIFQNLLPEPFGLVGVTSTSFRESGGVLVFVFFKTKFLNSLPESFGWVTNVSTSRVVAPLVLLVTKFKYFLPESLLVGVTL